MAVYRVNKNRGYTVMANYHLRDKTLSLKAVGLLSKMLSFNDGWQFSTKGLSAICKEGPDAVLAALRELEDHGYLIRHRQRDAKGRMSNTVFEIYEQPQPVSPHRENPDVDRGVRPFLSDKYDITKHPKYKMLSDYDKRNAFDIEKYRSHKLVVKPTQTFDLYDMGEVEAD